MPFWNGYCQNGKCPLKKRFSLAADEPHKCPECGRPAVPEKYASIEAKKEPPVTGFTRDLFPK